MYPKMWRLIKRDVLNIGYITIKSSNGDFYLTGQEKEPFVTTVDKVMKWEIHYGGTKGYILISEVQPQKQLTLSNAWDQEGNYLHIFQHNPNYPEAQLWQFTKNADGTYCIRTAYSSRRAVTVEKPGATAVIKSAETPSSKQKWMIAIAPAK